MKKGFTLAEVLITLGIIGVVAAMTIPTLIANTNSTRFMAQFKKSYSTLNQALRRGLSDHGLDFGALNSACSENPTSDAPDPHGTVCGLFNTTLSASTFLDEFSKLAPDYNPVAGKENIAWTKDGTSWIGYMLADGSVFFFSQHKGTCSESDPCPAFIDVNGAKGPNKLVNGVEESNNNDKEKCDPNATKKCSKTCPAGLVLSICKCMCEIPKPSNVTVPHDKEHMTDIYPIYFSGQTVRPATQAVQAVLHDVK